MKTRGTTPLYVIGISATVNKNVFGGKVWKTSFHDQQKVVCEEQHIVTLSKAKYCPRHNMKIIITNNGYFNVMHILYIFGVHGETNQ